MAPLCHKTEFGIVVTSPGFPCGSFQRELRHVPPADAAAAGLHLKPNGKPHRRSCLSCRDSLQVTTSTLCPCLSPGPGWLLLETNSFPQQKPHLVQDQHYLAPSQEVLPQHKPQASLLTGSRSNRTASNTTQATLHLYSFTIRKL